MLRDLQELSEGQAARHVDVAIVGGGIAGLLVGAHLGKHGVRSVVLESGSAASPPDPDPLNEVLHDRQIYRGADFGRVRGLGGTSLRWGGAMLPFQPGDLGPHTAQWPVDWPLDITQLASQFSELETLLRLPAGPFDVDTNCASCEANPTFVLRSAKIPPFSRRNVAKVLRKQLDAGNTEIWLNATVVDFELNENGRLAGVTAESPAGNRVRIHAKSVIVAAGAIESTRLLLLLDARNDNQIFAPDGNLGHYFYDHLAAPAAMIEPHERATLNETFGMRFVPSGMRDIRIEASVEMRRRLGLPGAFAHVRACPQGDDAFTALRSICRSLQSRSRLDARDVRRLGRDWRWLAEAGYWRFFKHRVLAPRNAAFELTLIIEQFPDAGNTISLSPDQRDRYDMPLAKIAWRTSPEDCRTFERFQSLLTRYWKSSPFKALGALRATPACLTQRHRRKETAFFHPGGTTRMSKGPATGVVDANLKTHRIDNLYVVSTSSFPSGGGSNPTFTLMALALRTAEQVRQSL